ncbi:MULTISPECIES: hypothetical protein [unclassified Acinetobacter]|uniref:hypothetical protein n=1 Tax=unclassified Acinetobacter TaxID=196816 RepID=UPI0015D22C6F|nr:MULTISPECIES: hypothetical protein [unclassified Acinetobacter]
MSEIKQVWGIIKDYQCADLKMVQDPALAVFQHQQAKIEKLENELSTTKQVLGNVIDMEVAKVDNLKAQLNNMEACYIEKKKQVETVGYMLEGDLKYVEQDRRGNFDFLQMAMIRCLGDALKALRGAND